MCKSANRHKRPISRRGSKWLEIVEKFYLCDTIEARRDVFDSVITRIRSGWCMLRDLVSLVATRNLPLGVLMKSRTIRVSSSFSKGQPRKTWKEVIGSDPKERKLSKDIAEDKSA